MMAWRWLGWMVLLDHLQKVSKTTIQQDAGFRRDSGTDLYTGILRRPAQMDLLLSRVTGACPWERRRSPMLPVVCKLS